MKREYYVIDAFTNNAFDGNPAAVILHAESLTDEQMLTIAAEFNLSETTFITKVQPNPHLDNSEKEDETAKLRFRWCTPTTEVDMCGHATLAGVHALIESDQLPAPTLDGSVRLLIDTRCGTLIAHIETLPNTPNRHTIWLDLISPTIQKISLPENDLAQYLNMPTDAYNRDLPPALTQDRDAIVFVKDFSILNDIKPDFKQLTALLEKHDLRGLSVATIATLTPSIHVQSRFFAPTCGIIEDPVTGSVHGPLGVYLVEHGVITMQDNVAGMQCTQGIPGGRTGLVWVLVRSDPSGSLSVRIGGQAVTTMRGSLFNCD